MGFVINMVLIVAHPFYIRHVHNSFTIITHHKSFNNVKHVLR